MVVDSRSGYHSYQADKSKEQCLSVLTYKTLSSLLVLLAAQSPDAGLRALSCTTTRSSLRHLLLF